MKERARAMLRQTTEFLKIQLERFNLSKDELLDVLTTACLAQGFVNDKNDNRLLAFFEDKQDLLLKADDEGLTPLDVIYYRLFGFPEGIVPAIPEDKLVLVKALKVWWQPDVSNFLNNLDPRDKEFLISTKREDLNNQSPLAFIANNWQKMTAKNAFSVLNPRRLTPTREKRSENSRSRTEEEIPIIYGPEQVGLVSKDTKSIYIRSRHLSRAIFERIMSTVGKNGKLKYIFLAPSRIEQVCLDIQLTCKERGIALVPYKMGARNLMGHEVALKEAKELDHLFF